MVNNRGFTAIELILVIVILGILAAIVYPKFQALPAIRTGAAAQTIAADIRYAESLAVSTRFNYVIYFYAGSDSYSVYKRDRSTGAETILAHPFKAGNYTVAINTEYPGVGIDNDYTVEFDSLGTPVRGGGSSVTVSSSGNTKTISVQANTGRVTIN